MTTAMTVLVCDTPQKVAQARQFLIQNGYSNANITDEQAVAFTYDAQTYASGAADGAANKYIVTGRR